MNPSHRRYLVNELIRGISDIGPQFESFGQRVMDHLVKEPLIHRGQNKKDFPVGHTIDSYSQSGEIAAEYSADEKYFEMPLKNAVRNFLRNLRTLATASQSEKVLQSKFTIRGELRSTSLTSYC